jgi:hypothetical protein
MDNKTLKDINMLANLKQSISNLLSKLPPSLAASLHVTGGIILGYLGHPFINIAIDAIKVFSKIF